MTDELIAARKNILFHYSPYSFLPRPDRDRLFRHSILDAHAALAASDGVRIHEQLLDDHDHHFVVKHLPWDTSYFGFPTFKLLFVHYAHSDARTLGTAVTRFAAEFFREGGRYCFAEIPSEDIQLIQALNEAGFRLVETRLTYYLDLRTFRSERHQVRAATVADAPNLKRVAREMRNEYDRFHADPAFSPSQADEFLATYVENSLQGFADIVLVPAAPGVPPDAFVTANYLRDEWEPVGERISKMVLSAVSSTSCKGWYIKLISEMAYHLREIGADYAFMHPATTNRAVIHSYEKLGCKYGKAVHVFSKNSLGAA